MANTILTPRIYASTFLKLLKNNLVMGKLVTTEFNDNFKKVGDTIYVKRPPEFVVREGRVAQIQDVTVGEQPVILNKQRGIDIEFTSIEDTLEVDDLLNNQIMQSKAAALAQEIDSCLMDAVLEFPNWVGVPGNIIGTPAAFFEGPKRLDNGAVPGDMRNAVLAVDDYWGLAAQFTNLNIYDNNVNMTALQRAKIPVMGNTQPYMTQSVKQLVTGTRTNGTLAGNGQEVDYLSVSTTYTQTLNVAGLGAGATVRRGEVFTIGTLGTGVRAVNPRTKAVLPYLQQFTVLQDAVADGAGAATLTIANPIILSGAFQNCAGAPTNGMAITWVGSASTAYNQNAAWHKSAIALAYAKLTKPATGESAYATDKETGVTVRYWKTSDSINDVHMHRWDVLFGVTNVDRRLGTRISGQAPV
jgi:hypothetical protein